MDGAVDSGAYIVGFIVVEAHCALAEIGESLDGGGDGVADGLEDGLLYILPLTTCWPGAVAAGTMTPPGHMQNEKTPWPSTWVVRL